MSGRALVLRAEEELAFAWTTPALAARAGLAQANPDRFAPGGGQAALGAALI